MLPDPNDLIIHSDTSDSSRPSLSITPERAGWEYISLDVRALDQGQRVSIDTGEREVCIIPLGGQCSVQLADDIWAISRPGTMFDGRPTSLYTPRRSIVQITAQSRAEIAIAGAVAERDFLPTLISSDDVEVEIRGAGNAARQINHIIPPEFPADRLLVVEVFTPSGNWSSYPPHKHDVSDMPRESDLEEIYYYRIDPAEGFGLQRLYTANRSFDHAWVIHDGDALLVKEGYHAFAVAHGFTGYYLNVLAGNEAQRTMQPSDDPAYTWVRETWNDDQNEGARTWTELEDRINRGAGRRS